MSHRRKSGHKTSLGRF